MKNKLKFYIAIKLLLVFVLCGASYYFGYNSHQQSTENAEKKQKSGSTIVEETSKEQETENLDRLSDEEDAKVEERLNQNPYYWLFNNATEIYHGDEPVDSVIKRVFDSSYGERQSRNVEQIPYEEWILTVPDNNGYYQLYTQGLPNNVYITVNVENERFTIGSDMEGG